MVDIHAQPLTGQKLCEIFLLLLSQLFVGTQTEIAIQIVNTLGIQQVNHLFGGQGLAGTKS